MSENESIESVKARLRKRIEIVDALRRAFENIKHFQTFNGKALKAIKAELPEYVVSLDGPNSLHSIKVWGKDIPYGDAFYMCWNKSNPWPNAMAEELNIADPRDSLERLEQEETLLQEFAALDRKIEDLQREALDRIKALPVPSTAKARQKSVFWDSPSSSVAKMFPRLFPR